MNSVALLNKEIKCFIFDMDGTLIDSTTIWKDIDYDFFNKRGIKEVPEEYANEIVHLGLYKGAIMTIERYRLKNDTVEGVIKEWTDASIDQYANKIPLKEKAIELLEYLKEKGVKIALATANDRALYEPCLKRLKIDQYFEIITDVNKVSEGKSSPKIFDSIIEQFGVKREETAILEDSIIGLKTAFDNGYFAIGVDDITTRNIEAEKKAKSSFYIQSFKDLLAELRKNN